MVRSALADVLEYEDFVVYQADRGSAALDSEQTKPSHAVVLAWDLPGTPDGAETLAYIRHRDPFLPVIVYASFPSQGLAMAVKLGATTALAKEYRLVSELPVRLRKVIAVAEQLSRDRQDRQRRLLALHDRTAARFEAGAVRLEAFGHGDMADARLLAAESSRRRADELRSALARERSRWDSSG